MYKGTWEEVKKLHGKRDVTIKTKSRIEKFEMLRIRLKL
jgi:hypothetical protein